MATRRFCDFCGNEIEDDDRCWVGETTGEATLRLHKLPAPVTLDVGIGVSPRDELKYDFCKLCIFKAVRQIDPTPVAVPVPSDEGGEE